MSSIEITPLDVRKHKENIIEIFSTAFGNYPLTQLFFGDAYKQSIKHLIESISHETSIVDNFFLGAFVEGKLQGFASISPPVELMKISNFKATADYSEQQFATAIGEKALMLIQTYFNLKIANKPFSPHFYIDLLGVHPENQGKGIGRALISKVHQMSKEHPISCGVALDTQTENNVSYYKHLGYSVSNTVELGNVQNWFMFRSSLEPIQLISKSGIFFSYGKNFDNPTVYANKN